MLKLLWSVILALVGLALVITVCWGLLPWVFQLVIGQYIPWYDNFLASKDVVAFLLAVLLWDRLFGPTSVLLRRAAKLLHKKKKRW